MEKLMRNHLAGAGIIFATALFTPTVHAQAPATTPHTFVAEKAEHPDLVKLRRQMARHPELPPVGFWFAVAQCETRQEWDRGWDWGPNAKSWVSGGLGIANKTWVGYGGRQFARKAAFASKWEQMIVANRVGFLGWQTDEYRTWHDRVNNNKFFRPAAGFDQGWGGSCRKQWEKKNR